jgi:hypothetical protein
MNDLLPFINGATTVLWLVAVVFFVRYWWVARDELFAWFAAAFVAFAAHAGMRGFDVGGSEHAHIIYVVRLAGFLMIVVGILRKNRKRTSHDSG